MAQPPGKPSSISQLAEKNRWQRLMAQLIPVSKKMAHWCTRFGRPLTITTPGELTRFINQHCRLLIRQCLDQSYKPYQAPPAIAYLTANACLWQHSLYSWRTQVSHSNYVYLGQRAEDHWLEACQQILYSQVGRQQGDRQVLLLRAGFHRSGNAEAAHFSRMLFTQLRQSDAGPVSLGMLRIWCDDYLSHWQAHVSSDNIIRILLAARH